MSDYVHEDVASEEIERQLALYGPLAQSIRELADASIRTEVDDDEVRAARAEVEAITARLRRRQLPGSYGVRFSSSGASRAWGNAVVGARNPVAPPVDVRTDPAGRAWADFRLGAAYEGPPGLVHGGKPGMTGTLTLRYRRGTPLGDVRAEAHIDRVEGVKTFVVGHLADAEGVTVEAEGVFILPRWARPPAAEDEPARFE